MSLDQECFAVYQNARKAVEEKKATLIEHMVVAQWDRIVGLEKKVEALSSDNYLLSYENCVVKDGEVEITGEVSRVLSRILH